MLWHRGQLKIVSQRLIGPSEPGRGRIMVMTVPEWIYLRCNIKVVLCLRHRGKGWHIEIFQKLAYIWKHFLKARFSLSTLQLFGGMFFKITPSAMENVRIVCVWVEKVVSMVMAVVTQRERALFHKVGLLPTKTSYSKQHKEKRREQEDDRGIQDCEERRKVISAVLGSDCVCLLYCGGNLVKISVSLYWHSREWEKGEEKKKEKEGERSSVYSLFLPSSCQSFPSLFVRSVVFVLLHVCVCVCVHTLTGTLESFTDYLTHVTSFWRAFNGGGLSGSRSLLTLSLPSLLPLYFHPKRRNTRHCFTSITNR